MDTKHSYRAATALRLVSTCLVSLALALASASAATLAGGQPLNPGLAPIDDTFKPVTGPTTGNAVRLLEAEEAVHDGSMEVAVNHDGYTGSGFVDFIGEGDIESSW
ncbi:MAG: hypothetical protein U9R74_18755 [Pseudomonadota bacterium]|nr:hypothetical protein [Pseudomonadota bacterium]